jgi:hypothetical protein
MKITRLIVLPALRRPNLRSSGLGTGMWFAAFLNSAEPACPTYGWAPLVVRGCQRNARWMSPQAADRFQTVESGVVPLHRKTTIRRTLIAAMVVAAVFLPASGFAAPDETQKQITQRAQEAKKKLAGAQTASGQDRHRLMQEHMKMMQEMMGQMQQAQPRGSMSPEQRREWMDEHMKLMHEMMGQMTGQHQMMMGGQGMGGHGMGGPGMGGPGMGGSGMGKK